MTNFFPKFFGPGDFLGSGVRPRAAECGTSCFLASGLPPGLRADAFSSSRRSQIDLLDFFFFERFPNLLSSRQVSSKRVLSKTASSCDRGCIGTAPRGDESCRKRLLLAIVDILVQLHVANGIDLTDFWPPCCVLTRFSTLPGDRGRFRTAPRGDEVHFRLFTDDLTDSFVRKTSRRCVDAVRAPLPRFFVEVFHLPVAF